MLEWLRGMVWPGMSDWRLMTSQTIGNRRLRPRESTCQRPKNKVYCHSPSLRQDIGLARLARRVPPRRTPDTGGPWSLHATIVVISDTRKPGDATMATESVTASIATASGIANACAVGVTTAEIVTESAAATETARARLGVRADTTGAALGVATASDAVAVAVAVAVAAAAAAAAAAAVRLPRQMVWARCRQCLSVGVSASRRHLNRLNPTLADQRRQRRRVT